MSDGEDLLLDVSIADQEMLMITAEKLLAEAGTDLHKQGQAINQICEMILKVNDPVLENMYLTALVTRYRKELGLTKKTFTEKIKAMRDSLTAVEEEAAAVEIPDDVDENMARKLGFFAHKGKYFFITKDGLFKASNFIVKPLFHIYSKSDNKRLIEITNEYGWIRIIDIPSKNFCSVDQFQQAVYSEGNFIFFGTKIHFMKILDQISGEFPVCNELKTLGWQREGFYAFANGIYNGKWQNTDQYGITEHKKQKYFSPAFSVVYSDVREDDDEYENDRYFIWQPSTVSFAEWCKLMIQVYGEKAIIAIGYLVASIFRDLIYEKYKIFPHLFLFGEKQSGKSQLAWSLSNVFFNNLPAFNRDDNALFTRSILLSFERKKYTDEEMRHYDRLKELELKGLSSLIGDVLKYREEVDRKYGMTFSVILEELKDELLIENLPFDERLLRNFCSILTPIKIISESIDPVEFGFSFDQIYKLSKRMISELSAQISSSEAVASFWHLVEFMLDNNQIAEHIDFKIETCDRIIRLLDKNAKKVEVNFSERPVQLLYIRFGKIHPLYLEAHRKQYGKNGVDMVSIEHYFKHHRAFVGRIESTRFENANTSAFVFRYEELGVNLVRTTLQEGEISDPDNRLEGKKEELPF